MRGPSDALGRSCSAARLSPRHVAFGALHRHPPCSAPWSHAACLAPQLSASGTRSAPRTRSQGAGRGRRPPQCCRRRLSGGQSSSQTAQMAKLTKIVKFVRFLRLMRTAAPLRLVAPMVPTNLGAARRACDDDSPSLRCVCWATPSCKRVFHLARQGGALCC